jgi:glycyl-tRNA synthetase
MKGFMIMEISMEKFVNFLKQQGFVYQGSEIYGGLANAWDYGPLGVELKNNIKKFLVEEVCSRKSN